MQKKQFYDVKLEILVPTTITYRVEAINETEALKEVDKISAKKIATKQNLTRRIKIKATVYNVNTTMMRLSKTYRNIQ